MDIEEITKEDILKAIGYLWGCLDEANILNDSKDKQVTKELDSLVKIGKYLETIKD